MLFFCMWLKKKKKCCKKRIKMKHLLNMQISNAFWVGHFVQQLIEFIHFVKINPSICWIGWKAPSNYAQMYKNSNKLNNNHGGWRWKWPRRTRNNIWSMQLWFFFLCCWTRSREKRSFEQSSIFLVCIRPVDGMCTKMFYAVFLFSECTIQKVDTM